MLSPSQSSGHDLHHSVWHHLLGSWCCFSLLSPVVLARGTFSAATVAAGNAGEVKAPGGDGHSITAEDAANSRRGGGSHSSVLQEGAEDGSGQCHHHGQGLTAAVGQWGWAAGPVWEALVIAGDVSGQVVHLGERAGRKHCTGTPQEQPAIPPKGS